MTAGGRKARALVQRVGRFAQGQFAQLVQIVFREKIFQRGGGAVGGINFPLLQPLAQFVGGQINVHNVVGLQHEAVGHAFAHVHARRAQNGVVQAFEVLDVQRGDDVDAREQ